MGNVCQVRKKWGKYRLLCECCLIVMLFFSSLSKETTSPPSCFLLTHKYKVHEFTGQSSLRNKSNCQRCTYFLSCPFPFSEEGMNSHLICCFNGESKKRCVFRRLLYHHSEGPKILNAKPEPKYWHFCTETEYLKMIKKSSEPKNKRFN